MKFLNSVIIFFALIIIVYLMYFVVVVEKFENSVSSDKIINSKLLNYSVMLQDTDDSKYKDLFENDIFNIIKYTDSANGIKWSKWKKGQIDNVTKMVREFVENKLKMSNKTKSVKIVYCSLNRFKENLNNVNEMLLDYDIVFHNKADVYADHVKILFVACSQTKKLDLVRYAVVGKVHEDKIYMRNDENEDTIDTNSHTFLSGYTQYKNNILNMEDTYESACSEDRDVNDLLYSKISRDDIEDEDYVKNEQYIITQNIVRKALLDKMLSEDDNGIKGGVYKKYPYSNDFIL